jgi:hypothetical protein
VWERYRGFNGLAALYAQEDAELIWVAVRDGDLFFKLRRPTGDHWQMAAFDLARDRGEQRDLFDPTDAWHAKTARDLEGYKASLVAAFRGRRDEAAIEAKRATELLRSLGYLD